MITPLEASRALTHQAGTTAISKGHIPDRLETLIVNYGQQNW